VSPKLKNELKKKAPKYIVDQITDEVDNALTKEDGSPIHFNQKSPDSFMKHLDTSFESFFYQRDYTERNFTFYL
jgi:hypothetical protein